MESNDYFHPNAIRRRVNRRYRGQFASRLHFFFTLLLTAVGFALFTSTPNELHRVTHLVFYLVLLWSLFLIHSLWRRSRSHAEAQIDAELREARDYDLGRYEMDRDASYRLSDDGELFYGADEIEYNVKPKRKRES